MLFAIGVDTGGTHTDAVLVEWGKPDIFYVRKTAKAFTTRNDLSIGIRNSIRKLNLSKKEMAQISKAVFSTTLATNAIVEGVNNKVGLISIGEKPRGKIATKFIKEIKGQLNIKGRVLVNINREAVKKTVQELMADVDSIAITGLASIKNPILEKQVEEVVHETCNLPVICGHDLSDDLGFLERTNTAVINAGLLPIIDSFTKAIINVLDDMNIYAPVFFIRGDGSIVEMNAIKNRPIETVLSGPAASMIGAISLTKKNDLVIADMGGTTTDAGLALRKRIALSKMGAEIGEWQIKIKSAQICTFGLGGDSEIVYSGGKFNVGPRRVLPACRGGGDVVTPTDLLHFLGEYVEWDKQLAKSSIEKAADKSNMYIGIFVEKCIDAVIDKAYQYNLIIQENETLPVCAVGAPAYTWYKKVMDKYKIDLIVPENFSVANAVGCAVAGIEETIIVIVRPGEEGFGYILHTKVVRKTFKEKEAAINEGVRIAKEYLKKRIRVQGLELGEFVIMCEDMHEGENKLEYKELDCDENGLNETISSIREDTYIETRITVRVSGKIFA
jgi:N-methylhydantoinase A/oxoprolinase/acetone carboxylase beta subunit